MLEPTENSKLLYWKSLSGNIFSIYWLILLFICIVISSLPFISTTVSVKSAGIIRPAQERTEVKPLITGIIDSLFIRKEIQ